MRYWDASALVPLIVDEPGTTEVRAWLGQDSSIITWAWTRVEIVSAIERRAREGELSRSQRRETLSRFEGLFGAWDEVTDVLAVRTLALGLLARHPLRAADAAQLGAALLATEGRPETLEFVCLDERLALAAEKEGLPVLPLPGES